MYLTISSLTNPLLNEIVKVTAVSGANITTMVRGQRDTSALAWNTGSVISLNLHAEDIEAFQTHIQSDGKYALPVGTVLLPGLYFAGDTPTGIYRPAPLKIGFACNGVSEGIVDANGWNGDIHLPDGSAAAPSLRLASDTDSGFYFAADGQIGAAIAGSAVGTIRATGWNGAVVGNVTGNLTGLVLASDGAVDTPSVAFANDPNTGLYSVGADSIGITTGGVLRLSVNTANVTSTLAFLAPAGTVSLPAYSFASDPDTGIYNPVANTIRIAVGGTRIVSINTAGVDILGNLVVNGGYAAATPNVCTVTGTGLYGANTGATLGLAIAGASSVEASATTMEWNVPQWNDANVGALVLKTGGTLPGTVQWLDNDGDATGIYTLGFAVNEEGSGVIEVPHDYDEGTNITFHLHWGINDAPSGTDYVKWELIYTLTRSGETFADVTSIVVETAVDTQYESLMSNFPEITGTAFKIGDQFTFTLKRITADGAVFTGEALVHTIGFHYLCNTLGSATISAK
jgi:hypothetical protein